MLRKTSGVAQQEDCRDASARSLEAAMETTSSEQDLSPKAKYCIDLDLTPMERSELSVSNSPSRFFCRFDPVTRKGKLLMLLFDCHGNSTLQEMSRLDVLRMTQESPAEASPFRGPGKMSPRRRQSGLQQTQAATDAGGSTYVCDVQV
jgi:hypothetical protein